MKKILLKINVRYALLLLLIPSVSFSAVDYRLIEAVKNKKPIEEIEELIKDESIEINTKCRDDVGEFTALHWAIGKNSNLDIINLFIKNKADIDNVAKGFFSHDVMYENVTPLHFAVILRYVKIAKLLIEQGANVNVQDKAKYTPLHYAVENNLTEVVEKLIEKGADVEIENKFKETALHLAVENENAEIAQILIASDNKGHLINAQNSNGKTALHLAVESDNVEIVKSLLKNPYTNFCDKDIYDKEPLHGVKSEEVAALFVAAGAMESVLKEIQDETIRSAVIQQKKQKDEAYKQLHAGSQSSLSSNKDLFIALSIATLIAGGYYIESKYKSFSSLFKSLFGKKDQAKVEKEKNISGDDELEQLLKKMEEEQLAVEEVSHPMDSPTNS